MRQARISASPAVHFAAVHISVLFAQAPCCEDVEVPVCMCVCIYIYIYIYIHTHTHTHTHTHMLLTPVLGGDGFLGSHSGRFTAGLKPPVPLA